MYLRFTPGLAVAIGFTSVIAVWFTVDVAVGNMGANIFSNAVTMAWVASWLNWSNECRSEQAARRAVEQRDAHATIHAVKSH
jgi:hypothetical protein